MPISYLVIFLELKLGSIFLAILQKWVSFSLVIVSERERGKEGGRVGEISTDESSVATSFRSQSVHL